MISHVIKSFWILIFCVYERVFKSKCKKNVSSSYFRSLLLKSLFIM